MTTPSRTTSSVNMGGGRTRVTRVTGNKISTSYKTKTKTGNGSCITQTSSNRGFTTTSSNKSGGVTRSVTTSSHRSTPKAPTQKSRSSPRSSSSRSRSSSNSGVLGQLLVASIVGLVTSAVIKKPSVVTEPELVETKPTTSKLRMFVYVTFLTIVSIPLILNLFK